MSLCCSCSMGAAATELYTLSLHDALPILRQVRGKGLMIGVELAFPGAEVVKEMMIRGVLSNCASTNVIRLVPPLKIGRASCRDRVEKMGVEGVSRKQEVVPVSGGVRRLR